MRSKSLAVLVAVAVAGCGGGDDSDDTEQPAQQPPEQAQTEQQSSTAPTKLTGKRTEANVIKTLEYEKQGDVYVASGGCQATAFAIDKAGVAALTKEADTPTALIKNDSGTAAVLLAKPGYFCAIQAANRLKRIP